MDVIYLDHNASSPLAEELLTELPRLIFESRANPSSSHSAGRLTRRLVTDATDSLSARLGCKPDQLLWTSGASEANTWAIHSAARASQRATPRFLLSPFEHDSTILAAQSRGQAEFLGARPDGCIDLEELKSRLASGPGFDLVSIVAANNETGVVQPYAKAVEACKAAGATVHVDCVQALGRLNLDLTRIGADYATFSAHKIGGPKGVGWLCARTSPARLIGGRQQRELRGGTENALGAALTTLAASLIDTPAAPFPERLAGLHAEFEAGLKARIPGAVVHGSASPRLRNTTYVGFEGTAGNGILMNLDLEGICASSGSACSSGTNSPSRALTAMGCEEGMARSSVRFSSGRATSRADFERVLEVLPEIVARVRAQ